MQKTEIGRRLPRGRLDLRTSLPVKPEPAKLTGSRVSVRSLDLGADLATLHRVSSGAPVSLGRREVTAYDADALIWRYMSAGPFADEDALAEYLQRLLDAEDGLPMCVIDTATGSPVGVVNLMSNVPAHLRIELGGIWYSPVVQGSGINAEVTQLLLGHVFGLGYRRAEWKCNANNVRSRRAALRMGFTFEGIFDAHLIVKGCSRDTAWFRVLDTEWPEVDDHLVQLVARSYTAHGGGVQRAPDF